MREDSVNTVDAANINTYAKSFVSLTWQVFALTDLTANLASMYAVIFLCPYSVLFSPKYGPPTSTLGGAGPEAEPRKLRTPIICHRCGQVGHKAANCMQTLQDKVSLSGLFQSVSRSFVDTQPTTSSRDGHVFQVWPKGSLCQQGTTPFLVCKCCCS
jgi:hypothetical protein